MNGADPMLSETAARMLRPSWVEIDLAALRANAATMRRFVGDRVRFVAVVKSNGFGCGAAPSAKALLAGGADAVAVGSPADVAAIRQAGITAPVLLYASTLPESAREVAGLGATVTLHDLDAVHAFAALGEPVEAYLKIEVGLGRLGIALEHLEAALATIRRSASLRVTGIYTHLSGPGDPARIAAQLARFSRACEIASAAGLRDLTRMTAGSHAVLAHPESHLDAVNPGRCLFGLLEGEWTRKIAMRAVVSRICSRILQVKTFAAGESVGYLGGAALSSPKRLAVFPMGFGDGFNHLPPLGEALVAGKRVPLMTRRGIEHMVIDVTAVPQAQVGSEVVLLGRQGEDLISAAELCEWVSLPMLELLPRLARTIPRVYLD